MTNSKQTNCIQNGNELKVHLTKLPIDGKANCELIKLLSNYFSVKKNQIKIIKGKKSKNKIICIERYG
ncbi:MAG: DUF167 domain-containing protein [Candidatus Woesearchaeota archaeon]